MNKKGIAWFFLIELVLGIFAAVLVAHTAADFGSKEVYKRTRLARDYAITINTLYGVSGNVEIYYPENVSRYNVVIEDGKVEVYEFASFPKSTYYFVPIGEFEPYRDKKDIIILSKKSNKVGIGALGNALNCPEIDTKDNLNYKKILLDYENQGRLIALTLKNSYFDEASSTRALEYEEKKKVEERRSAIKEDIDLVVSVNVIEGESARVYLSKEQNSKKLGCLILNNFNNYDELVMLEGEEDSIMDTVKLGVQLVIGNEHEDFNRAVVTKGIYDAIKEYYE